MYVNALKNVKNFKTLNCAFALTSVQVNYLGLKANSVMQHVQMIILLIPYHKHVCCDVPTNF